MKKIRTATVLISAAILTLILGFTSLQPVLHSETSKTADTEGTVKEVTTVSASPQEEQVELTHEEVISLTDQFMEKLVQNTDEWYKVTDYNSKEAFIQDFTQLTSRSVAEKYINTYYIQKEDGVYVIPTSTPPWFVNDQEYERKRTAADSFIVTQANKSELHGEYTIELEFRFEEKWRITNTEYQN